ncbi:type VI secretion system protein TssL, long form [Prosthecomicrobium sp. N25]|uniref:type VI secretion system protein TssL, long form n=1 Tax=Prosthecomicrobium sp. N25 TaxID=3129254 RepID=UPI00307837E7
MSDDAFDAYPDRTVFRPNPGGRRPAAAPQPGPPAGPGPARPQDPVPRDTWGVVPGPEEFSPPPPRRERAFITREEMIVPHQNPMVRSAGPVLLLLGRLRIALSRASPAELMETVAASITALDDDLRLAGVPQAPATVAKYVICATADDIVQNIPAEDRHVWTRYSMLSRFFGERIGGVRFFSELEKAIKDPTQNRQLIELVHVCLALGFQGLHRHNPNGVATLQGIQRNTYEVLKSVSPRPPVDISPRWRGLDLKAKLGRLRLPFWVVAAFVAAALTGLYITYRTLLTGEAELAADGLLALHPAAELTLYRKAPAPPPPRPVVKPPTTTQLQRIRAALAPEIAAGEVSADAVGTHIVVRVGNALLFDSGKADVKDEFKPLAGRIAEVLEKEVGPVIVIGHTDNTPLRSSNRFKTNFELSVARANAVGRILGPQLSDPGRITPEGRGEQEPVLPNTSDENKAKNRRVEVWIDKVD